jgi:hypothetical protein
MLLFSEVVSCCASCLSSERHLVGATMFSFWIAFVAYASRSGCSASDCVVVCASVSVCVWCSMVADFELLSNCGSLLSGFGFDI